MCLDDILSATIPLEDQDETPAGFAQAGHIGKHSELRVLTGLMIRQRM